MNKKVGLAHQQPFLMDGLESTKLLRMPYGMFAREVV